MEGCLLLAKPFGRGALLNLNHGIDIGPMKVNLHGLASKHHAYDRGARPSP